MKYFFKIPTRCLAACAFLGSMLGTTAVHAIPITFTIAGTGSGSLNTTLFTDAAFSFALNADTDNLQLGVADIINPLDTAIFEIAGVGTGTFLIGTRIGQNNSNQIVFFSRSTGSDLFDFEVGSNLDLSTSFGPLPNTNSVLALNQFNNVSTTVGLLGFSAARDVLFSSELSSADVPEPAIWSLLVIGLGAMLRGRRRFKG